MMPNTPSGDCCRGNDREMLHERFELQQEPLVFRIVFCREQRSAGESADRLLRLPIGHRDEVCDPGFVSAQHRHAEVAGNRLVIRDPALRQKVRVGVRPGSRGPPMPHATDHSCGLLQIRPTRPSRRALRRMSTKAMKIAQVPRDKHSSTGREGRTRIYPCPLIRAAKLETQKGIRNRRNACHRLAGLEGSRVTLRSRAMPMTALMPSELSQIAGEGSKWATTVTKYQSR